MIVSKGKDHRKGTTGSPSIVNASHDMGAKVLRKLSEKVTFTIGNKMCGHGVEGHKLDVGKTGMRP